MDVVPRYPSSAPSRRALGHLRLLTAVCPWGEHALGFAGRSLRPGSACDLATLPRPAVVLECAGPVGNRERAYLWILWKMDFATSTWRELARAEAPDWTWAIALRPAAVRALYGETPPVADLGALARGIVRVLDDALAGIDPAERPQLLSAIEPEVAGRIAVYL